MVVSRSTNSLSIRTSARRYIFSDGVPIVLFFSDGSDCEVLPPPFGRAANIPVGAAHIVAIEAGICDSDEEFCIPLRVELP